MHPSDPANEIARVYNESAEKYLRHWADVLVPPGRALVDGLDLSEASTVVEVAAGTGRLLPYIAGSAPSAVVIGMDFAEGMIGLASAAHPRVVADARSLPLRDETVDALIMAFALFHIVDPLSALSDMARVLMSGGQAALGTWSVYNDFPAEDVFTDELDRLGVPEAEPRPSSRDLVDSEAKMTSLLETAGFIDVRTRSLDVIDPMSVDEFLERRTSLGLQGERFRNLAPDLREGFLTSVRRRLERLDADDLTSNEVAVLSWARKP